MPGPRDQFNDHGIIGYTNSGHQTIERFVSNVVRERSSYVFGSGRQTICADPDFSLNRTTPSLRYKKSDFNLSNTRSLTAGKSWNYLDSDEIKANNVFQWGINQYLISGGTNFENKTTIQNEVSGYINIQLAKINDIVRAAAYAIPLTSGIDDVNRSSMETQPQFPVSPTDGKPFSFLTHDIIVQSKIEVLQGFFQDFDKVSLELELAIDKIQKLLKDNHHPVSSLSLAANGLVAEVFSDPNKVIADRRALSPEAKLYLLPGVPLSFADPNMPGWLDNPNKGMFPAHNNVPTAGFRTYTEKTEIKFSPTMYPSFKPYDNTPHIPKIMESFLATTPENMILSVDKHQSNIGNYNASILLNYDLGYEGGEFNGYNASTYCLPEVAIHCNQDADRIGGTVRVTQSECEIIASEVNILTQDKSDDVSGGFISISKEESTLGHLSISGLSGVTLKNGNVNIIAKSEIRFTTEKESDIFHVDERRLTLGQAALQIILSASSRPVTNPFTELHNKRLAILERCSLNRDRIQRKISETKSTYQMFDKGFIVESDQISSSATTASSSSSAEPSSSSSTQSTVDKFGAAPPPPPGGNSDPFSGFAGHKTKDGWQDSPVSSVSPTNSVGSPRSSESSPVDIFGTLNTLLDDNKIFDK